MILVSNPTHRGSWDQARAMCKSLGDYDLAVPSDSYYNDIWIDAMHIYGCKYA